MKSLKPSSDLYSLEVKPPRAPLFLAALFFSAGILFARYCSRPSAWIVVAVAAFTVAAIFFLAAAANTSHMPSRF